MSELRIHGALGGTIFKVAHGDYVSQHVVVSPDGTVSVEWFNDTGESVYQEIVANGTRRVFTYEVQ